MSSETPKPVPRATYWLQFTKDLGFAQAADLASYLAGLGISRIKLRIVSDLLQLRRQDPDLFASGSYAPLSATGPAFDRICAFARAGNEATIVVAASLYPMRASLEGWDGSAVPVPEDEGDRWVNLFDSKKLKVCAGAVSAAELFQVLPVAVLVPQRIFVGC